MKQAANAAIISLSLLWLGILVGVSFIATPVKFTAPSLTLPVALDVGRVTFALFSKIEWGMIALLLVALIAAGWRTGRGSCAAALLAIVAVQSFWLLPVLDVRVAAIIAGENLPATSHHTAYVVLELAKACLLIAIAAGVSLGVAGVRKS